MYHRLLAAALPFALIHTADAQKSSTDPFGLNSAPATATITITPPTPTPDPGKRATPSTAKKQTDPDNTLLTKLAKIKFDRRPSTILTDWAKPEGDEPEPTPDPKDPKTPPAKPKNEADMALEALALNVTRGDWQEVAAFFNTAFKKPETASKGYAVMLQMLARTPRPKPVQPKPGSPPVPRQAPTTIFESNVLSPTDVLGLADACPTDLDPKTHIAALGAMLRSSVAKGHFPDAALELLAAGTLRLGGATDLAKRTAAARLLIAAAMPIEAGDFLPEDRSELAPETLELLASYHLALNASEPKSDHLAAAWDITQTLLAHPDLKPAAKASALARAVELAPKVEKQLGARWLGESFTGDAARGREVLGTIGSLTSAKRGERSADARLRRLQLQKTAVDALLSTEGVDLKPWKPALNLLALNWLAEGEFTYKRGTGQSIRPQMQWDQFGNMYYGQPQNRSMARPPQQGNIPSPVPTGTLLKARPEANWMAQIDPDLLPKFSSLSAQLYLKANEPEEAFPYIEKLAADHPDAGKDLAEEFIRIWSDNHDPNASRNRTYRYGYMYGYNQRANSIPLTRSKQERNLAELSKWVKRLGELPIKDLDQDVLAAAFTKVHSRAEVYKLDAITRVFGGFEAMEPDTVAALATTMRQNLASVWRNPKTQQDAKTKRKDKDILAEVDRGYSAAQDIVLAAMEKHPDDPQLWLARATLFFDHNNFLQENGGGSDFVAARTRAYEMFAKGAALYVANLPEDPAEESTKLFEHWFYAGLGASDLGALRETQQPAPAQFNAIRAALESIPGDAAERHMARFANALAARISSVKPELKQRYLKHGLGIVGDHEKAAEARKVFEYYADLISEIQLVAKVDSDNSAVGHLEPFGLAVDIRHTKEIERESGGFSKYLTNQNNSSYSYNYGRPTQNYREKFEDTARAALAEHFEVLSVTFYDSKVRSRGTAREGWRITPYAYILMRPKTPEVDKVPPLQIDLDFLDTSGFVILPVATAAQPIDARGELPTGGQIDNVKITQTLDERDATEGKLGLEIKASARGLLPPLEQLLEIAPTGFDLSNTEGGDLSVIQLEAESENPGPISERSWTLTFEAAAETPETFAFPAPKVDVTEVLYQRYDDADLVDATSVASLTGGYAKSAGGWVAAVAVCGIILLALIGAALFWPKRDGGAAVAEIGRYAVPEEVTPFTVISLLRKIRDGNQLAADTHSQLNDSIDKLERHYFDRRPGEEPDLAAIATEWVRKAA